PSRFTHRSALVPYTTLFRSRRQAGPQITTLTAHAEITISQSTWKNSTTITLGLRTCWARMGCKPRSHQGKNHAAINANNTCGTRSEEHTSELQSRIDLVCRL